MNRILFRFFTLALLLSCPSLQAQELNCKVKVMQQYPGAIWILIGDSITDLHGARHARVVFARDKLQGYLKEEQIAFHPFETFHDIIQTLGQFQGGKAPVHGQVR